MIGISCSNLERARRNRVLFAELLSDGDKLSRGGTFGMFRHWQEIAKRTHMGDVGLGEALRQLESACEHFAVTTRNRDKQAYLMEEFVRYMKRHKSEKLVWNEPRHQFRWQLIPQVRLTGITPWVFKREDIYYAYFCLEQPAQWQEELKYPLLQRYLADHLLHCRLNQLQIGVYCLERRDFEWKRFLPLEVRTAVQEASQLFTDIFNEYSRLREDAGH